MKTIKIIKKRPKKSSFNKCTYLDKTNSVTP